jgi:hypothetical protein
MDYYNIDRISQSLIKKALSNTLTSDKTSSGFELGKLVDAMLTQPELLELYVVSKAKEPGPSKKKIFGDYIVDRYTESCDIEELAEEAYQFAEYANKTPKAYLEEFESDPWFKDRMQSKLGFTVVSEEDYNKAQAIVSSLLNHHNTRDIVREDARFQEEIYFNIYLDGTAYNCKSLLDMVVEKDNTIQPYDIKTTRRPTYEFYKDIIAYRYDIQAYFYELALKAKYPDKVILPLKFIVESTSYVGTPVIVSLSEQNRQKAIEDIYKGLILISYFDRYGVQLISDITSEVIIEDLWEEKLSSILLDKSIALKELEVYSQDTRIALEGITLELTT